MANELEVVSITTTVGSPDTAKALAARILEHRLAACVQLEDGLHSMYRWNGALREEPEVRLVIKTVAGCVAGLQALFEREHPYELPQFLVSPMSASPAYAAWVRAEVLAAGDA